MKKLQAVIFNKNRFGFYASINWLESKGLSPLKIHETRHYYRFRMREPDEMKRYYSKNSTTLGVKFIIEC